MNLHIQQNLQIPEESAGKRLDHALSLLLPDYSRMQIQAWIQEGAVTLNNQVVKSKTKVKGGETVVLNAMLESTGEWLAEALPLDIVFEDEYLLVINKPANVVVHPGAGNKSKTLLNALLHHAEGQRLLPRAGILHRIDKDTTGLLIVAKTVEALTHLQRDLSAKRIKREYLALVKGQITSGGRIDAPIGRHPKQRTKMAVVQNGKPAATSYRVKQRFPFHTLLHVQLETGRTHQIRVHMAHIGHPIVGDPLYGSREKLTKKMPQSLVHAIQAFKRQALHAFYISFAHPITKKTLTFELQMPEDMQQLIKMLVQKDDV